MIRNFKTLGVAVIAVLAMSAVVASAASASNFTASSYPTSATASSAKGNDDFKTEAGSVECKAHFTVDALNAPSETATVTPVYTECQAFGFLSATVDMNGCDYVFHANGEVDVECHKFVLNEKGETETVKTGPIKIVASTCEATVGTQTGLKSVALSNSGTGISAKANVGGIAYTVTKDGFLCPFSGTGAKTGATYTQNNAVQVSSTNGATIDIG